MNIPVRQFSPARRGSKSCKWPKEPGGQVPVEFYVIGNVCPYIHGPRSVAGVDHPVFLWPLGTVVGVVVFVVRFSRRRRSSVVVRQLLSTINNYQLLLLIMPTVFTNYYQ